MKLPFGMPGMTRAGLLAVAVFVAVFVALYPYLDAAGACGDGGCPHLSQAHAPELPTGGFAAALVAVVMAPVLAARAVHRPDSDLPPAETCIAPDPRPPQS
jgi:hypothetical protein